MTLAKTLAQKCAAHSMHPVMVFSGSRHEVLDRACEDFLQTLFAFSEESLKLLARGDLEDLCVVKPQGETVRARLKKADVESVSAHFSVAPRYRFRVAVIEEAESLTVDAANSLLKILEEPPRACFVIMKTLFPRQMLATIRSRALQVRFARTLERRGPSSDAGLWEKLWNEKTHLFELGKAQEALAKAGSLNQLLVDAELSLNSYYREKGLPLLGAKGIENFAEIARRRVVLAQLHRDVRRSGIALAPLLSLEAVVGR